MSLPQPFGEHGAQQYPYQRQHHVHLSHHFHRRDKEGERDIEERQYTAVTDSGAQIGPESHERDKVAALDGFGSRTPSRRPSLEQLSILVSERSRLPPGTVKQEREKSVLRAAELNKSLLDLSTLANTSTRRLDNSYYAVLEKLGALQDNVASLKDLALKTRQVDERFSTEKGGLVQVIDSQLNDFDKFQAQERKINDLQDRIKTGRQKVEVLGSRLDATQDRVEQWSMLDTQRQRTTQQRLKVFWSVTAVSFTIVLLFLTIGYPSRNAGPFGTVQHPELAGNHGHPVVPVESVNSSLHVMRLGNDAVESLKGDRRQRIEEDPRMRAFDEL